MKLTENRGTVHGPENGFCPENNLKKNVVEKKTNIQKELNKKLKTAKKGIA